MNDISSNSVMASFSSQFDYAPIRQATLNAGRSKAQEKDDANGDLFQQNLNEELNSSGQRVFGQNSQASIITMPMKLLDPASAPPPPTGESNALEYADSVIANVESGKSLAKSMLEAKAEMFKLLFGEKLEENGGDVKKAAESARAELGVEMSDQELLGILHDMAEEYKSSDPKLSAELGEYSSALSEKMKEEEKKMESSMHAAESPLNLNASQQKNTDSQVKNPTMNAFHSRYVENQNATSRYESKREPFDLMV